MKKFAIVQSPQLGQFLKNVEKAMNEGCVLEDFATGTTVIGQVAQQVVMIYIQTLSKEEELIVPPGRVS